MEKAGVIIKAVRKREVTSKVKTNASTLMGLAGVSVKHRIIFHSDRGSQYCSYGFQKKLQAHKTLSSMSKKGDCWDNSHSYLSYLSLRAYEKMMSSKKAA